MSSNYCADQSSRPAGVIVFERKPVWAALFRRNLPDQPVVEMRIWDNLLNEITARPGSVLCIAAENAKIERVTVQIRQLRSSFSGSPIIVAGPRDSEEFRWISLECGAHAVVRSPRDVQLLASTIKGHLANVVPPEQTFQQRIRARLPWKKHSSKFK